MTPAAIKSARRQLGLSVNAFAAALGVQPQTVRRWEMDLTRSGSREPSTAAQAHIAAMLAQKTGTSATVSALKNEAK